MQDVMRRAHIHERVRWSSSHLSTSVELDGEIYRAFRDAFPQASVDVLKDSQLRGQPGWRFLESFRGRIADVDRLTILKRDVRRPLEQSNIDLVGRGVWLAVEVARRIELGDRSVSCLDLVREAIWAQDLRRSHVMSMLCHNLHVTCMCLQLLYRDPVRGRLGE